MKTTAFRIFYAGVLISLAMKVETTPEGSRKGKQAKEENPPPRPSFPLFVLPSFSLPGFSRFPYLNGLSQPQKMASVRATKTEYMEVTRRQTVHPVCYTAYEPKAPCLPHGVSDLRYDDLDSFDFDSVHEAHESFDLNEVRKSIEVSPATEVVPTEAAREAKYLEFRPKIREEVASSRLEGSEFIPIRYPAQPQPTEYLTKTVLITKLEKYTDRRVTATLLALNCLPADRSIPMCHSYPSPIRETPDQLETEAKLNVTQSESKAEGS